MTLVLVFFVLVGCAAPTWANWKLVIRDNNDKLVQIVYCEVYYRERVSDIYCIQPGGEKRFSIPENGSMQAYSIEHVIP